MDRNAIREILQTKLSPKRFEHTLGVEYTAGCLAICHNVDVEKALYAGLLHDCAKHIKDEKKIDKCRKYDIPVNEFELATPELLHAKIGAFYAKTKYEIQDEEIITAIKFHTTGRPNMTDLEMIIFIADYIEPNRKPLPNIDSIRKLAFSSLPQCTLAILNNMVNYLKTTDVVIDTTTIETYEYYQNLLNNKGEKR